MHRGERIRQARLEQGRTLQEVAEQLGTFPPVLWRWERGQRRFDRQWLEQLADVLDIPREELAALPEAPGRPVGRPRTAAAPAPDPARRTPTYPPGVLRLTPTQAEVAQRVFTGDESLGARFHPPAGLEILDLADARRTAMAAVEAGDGGVRRLARKLLDFGGDVRTGTDDV